MTVEEKIRTMELLWNDLCRENGGVESPDWHQKVLSSREDSSRDEDYINWEVAKKQIRRELE